MAVFWILTSLTGDNGKQAGFVFECDAADIDDLVGKLKKDLIVAGNRLRVVTNTDSKRVIEGRDRTAITAHGIGQIQPYMKPLREWGG